MNTLEHNNFNKEALQGFHFGVVISVNDPDKLKRVKVRVRGLFDLPIEKEHIPWAMPMFSCALPGLGEEVAVVFMQDDIRRPYYFPKNLLNVSKKELYSKLYSGIVSDKKASVKEGVSVVTSTFSEPATESTGELNEKVDVLLLPEDVVKETAEGVGDQEPEKGFMVETVREKGKESYSVTHPSGSFIDIHSDGTVVVHSVADVFLISEKKICGFVGGDLLLHVDGKVMLEVGDLTVKSTNMKITGGVVEVSGTVAPGSGPFCAIPNCVFSGAPHGGNVVSGT